MDPVLYSDVDVGGGAGWYFREFDLECECECGCAGVMDWSVGKACDGVCGREL